MVLLELFDKPLPYTWQHGGDDSWMATFKTSGGQDFAVDFDNQGDGEYEVLFASNNTDENDSSYGLTNKGEQYQVLGTVISTIIQFLHKFPDISRVIFSAKEDSRIKVYGSLIKRFLPATHKLEVDHGVTNHSGARETMFIITKS